ncbi:hypothetical protein ACLILV_09185 [Acinetobacter johnsonii]|uniref:hypothetical protein n=1 Tax=Acinetobacter johnsonii TaxID=40214 RepID=UPI0039854F6F
MNKLLQASLVATLMSAGSTALYAGNNWENCTSAGCEKDIPIKLNIPKKCEVLGGTAITLNQNGGTQSSTYKVRSNTHYTLNIQTANAGTSNTTFVKHEDDANVKVPTTITTAKAGGGSVGWGNSNHAGLADDIYTVTVNNSAVSAFQRAGTYNDTYKIKVYY